MKLKFIDRKSFRLSIVYSVLVFSIIVLYHFDPATSSGIYPPSFSRKIGGFYCAGCGTLRSLHQLLHGNFKAVVELNPLLIFILPYLLYWFIAYHLQVFLRIKIPLIIWREKQIFWFSLTIFLYSIMRNIDLYPFSLLAP